MSRLVVITIIVVGAGRVAVAQPDAAPSPDAAPPADAPPPPQPIACSGTIDGHAVDAETHDPIVGATVRIGNEHVAITDQSGRFDLAGICPGPVALVVERPDYLPGTGSLTLSQHASIEIEMTPSGEVIEIVDTAPPPPEMRATATITGADLERTRGRSFSAALAEVPGVSELRAATGMAKPIVRGQFGRRLLLLVDDVRHRAQDWGLDHAPEIDPFVADRIRVVRGPGGVRYGSDAIGGAVLVDPPALRREPGYDGEAHAIGATNGRGGTFAGRVRAVLERMPALSTQLEGSVKRLAAPTTPAYALDNTGAFEWSAGALVAYRQRDAEYKLSYRRYQADLGVCSCLRIHNVDDFLAQAEAGEPIGADEFVSEFAIDRPSQSVVHDTVLARARWDRDGVGSFIASYAFQHDLRREYDVVRNAGTAGAQFNFRLFSHDAAVEFDHDPIHLSDHWHVRGAAGVVGLGQIHHYGGLQLVPDFTSIAGGVYATERLVGHATDVEVGARYDVLARTASLERIDFLRLVRSGQLAMEACGNSDGDKVDCASRYHTFTASLGALQRFGDAWSLKGEVSAASRAPNTDEQYLNGTSPTFPVLGLGKPDIRPETTYATSVTAAYSSERVTAEASAFVNLIDDYIYFAPALDDTGMPIFDVLIRGTFPRFTTQATDALFYGADGGIQASPIPALELGAQASLVRAKDADDGSYFVFVPSDRYRGSVTFHPPDLGAFTGTSITAAGTYVTRQRRFDIDADFIAPPPAYFLLSAEASTETCIADQRVRFAIQGANLTNQRYRDYTSLVRYFADEPGWQVWLRASVFFDSNKKGN